MGTGYTPRHRCRDRPHSLPPQPGPGRQGLRLGELPRAPRVVASRSLSTSPDPGWLPNNSPRLAGNVAHVFTDVNDDDVAQASEEIHPSGNKSWKFPLVEFTPEACVPEFVCTWDPEVANSWQTNKAAERRPAAVVPRPLPRPPRGRAHRLHPGRRQLRGGRRRRGLGERDRRCRRPGLTASHVDNANMSTPPDGIPPRMQMYLFHGPGPRSPMRTRSSLVTPATRPTSSTTSTPTASPTASWSTPSASRRWATSRRARWVRPGRTGTPWTSSSTRDSSGTRAATASSASASTSAGATTSSAPSRSTARSAPRRRPVPGTPGSRAGRLHLRRLRQDHRRARGARRR